MIDAPTYAVLQGVIRRESRSLLQYVSESFPWTTRQERAALAPLQQLIEEERRGAADLGRFLVRQRLTPPYVGPYPTDFTTINYVSLAHLWPLLIDNERRAIVDLEQDLSRLEDGEARELVQRALAKKRQHLQVMQGLAAAQPEPVPA